MEEGVDSAQVRELLLRRFGLRVKPQMGEFVLARLGDRSQSVIPVMGGDARTGVAIRQLLAADDLRHGLASFASA